jgi:cold shock CspA family protein
MPETTLPMMEAHKHLDPFTGEDEMALAGAAAAASAARAARAAQATPSATRTIPADLGQGRPQRGPARAAPARSSSTATAAFIRPHEPERLQRKFQRPDLHNAINEAFRIAERQLTEFKDKLADRTKTAATHEAANEFLGQVAEMAPEKDHGFVMTKEGGLLYFHRNAVLIGDFDRLRRGDAVSYVEEVGDTGPMATKIRVKPATNGAGT